MAHKPNVGISVDLGDIGIEINSCSVISVFVAQSLNETGLVATEGTRITVTDLPPKVLASLGTTAAEKEIVV